MELPFWVALSRLIGTWASVVQGWATRNPDSFVIIDILLPHGVIWWADKLRYVEYTGYYSYQFVFRDDNDSGVASAKSKFGWKMTMGRDLDTFILDRTYCDLRFCHTR